MATYSHSRISTFEQCKYKYKLQYIDKIKPEVETTVEAFMGSLVHKTLEKLYKDIKFKKIPKVEELVMFYNNEWKKEWTDTILIAKQQYSGEDYQRQGESFIIDYYSRCYPFDQFTIIGLETQDTMMLPNGDHYHVRIDKLCCKGDVYYVCDYKTNATMKSQEEADADRQLAMYSVWVKDRFRDAKKVVLLWHMLAFGKDVMSVRTEEQLAQLQKETVDVIKKIEQCSSFPTTVTALCNYCVYKSMCPSFKHEIELEEKPAEKFKEDDGVKLVDEFDELKQKSNEIEDRMNELKLKLIMFAKQQGVDVIYGSNKKAAVKEHERIKFPEEMEQFTELLRKKGIYDKLATINYMKLSSMISKGELDREILGMIKKEKDFTVILSKKDF